ncbi:MAG: hypothetical protein Q4E09_06000 [Eubacteriales bacterium]|nr:hypothetical protein [Eubacteriales bacterium]
MARIKGITVTLITKIDTGKDALGNPISKEVRIPVDNVLVSPTNTEEILNSLNLYGKKVTYTLAIPKDDSHDWEDAEVEFFDERWQTLGIPLEGIEEMIPLDWNKKVMVTRCE